MLRVHDLGFTVGLMFAVSTFLRVLGSAWKVLLDAEAIIEFQTSGS